MKNKFYKLLCLVFFCMASHLSGQGVQFANTFNGKSAVYGITDSTVFKLDPNGNSIWVKDFSGQIAPSNFNNHLVSLAFNGEKLILLELQGESTGGPPTTFYPAVIRLDTLGNVLSTFVSAVQPAGGYGVVGIYPSHNNGAWVLDVRGSGITYNSTCFQIDSVGQIHGEIDFWYGSISFANKLAYLPGATCVVSASHRPSTPGTSPSFPALTRFDRFGNVLWRWDYTIAGSVLADYFYTETMTTDSLGNIYLFCDFYSNTFTGVVGIKLNSSGTVVLSKAWPALLPNMISSLTFQNSQLTCIWNDQEIQFDSLLNNPCLQEQNYSIVKSNNIVQTFVTHQYSFDNFSPSNGNAFTFIPDTLVDYCTSLSTEYFNLPVDNIILYPNPAGNYLSVALNNQENVLIEIYNLNGQLCLTSEINSSKKLDLRSLPAGLYSVRLITEKINMSKRLIIE